MKEKIKCETNAHVLKIFREDFFNYKLYKNEKTT